MSTVIRTRIVRIGNSQGIRIPKLVLEQTGIEGEVELELRDKQILIRQTSRPRHNWGAAFKDMVEQGDDELLDDDGISLVVWDEEEWEW